MRRRSSGLPAGEAFDASERPPCDRPGQDHRMAHARDPCRSCSLPSRRQQHHQGDRQPIRADPIIIDEVSLLPVSTDSAETLFRVVDAAYEERSIAISSNTTRPDSTSSSPGRSPLRPSTGSSRRPRPHHRRDRQLPARPSDRVPRVKPLDWNNPARSLGRFVATSAQTACWRRDSWPRVGKKWPPVGRADGGS
jgi:IstB-like ATP binding protein